MLRRLIPMLRRQRPTLRSQRPMLRSQRPPMLQRKQRPTLRRLNTTLNPTVRLQLHSHPPKQIKIHSTYRVHSTALVDHHEQPPEPTISQRIGENPRNPRNPRTPSKPHTRSSPINPFQLSTATPAHASHELQTSTQPTAEHSHQPSRATHTHQHGPQVPCYYQTAETLWWNRHIAGFNSERRSVNPD